MKLQKWFSNSRFVCSLCEILLKHNQTSSALDTHWDSTHKTNLADRLFCFYSHKNDTLYVFPTGYQEETCNMMGYPVLHMETDTGDGAQIIYTS